MKLAVEEIRREADKPAMFSISLEAGTGTTAVDSRSH